MKKVFKIIQRDNVLLWSFWTTIALIILMILGIALSYTNLPPFIPLYNQLPWGYSRLAKTYELFLLPLSILIVCLCNTTIGIRLTEKVPLLTRFLFLTMVSLAFFASIFVGRLIFMTL